eukprot:440109-Rhodomonas_salina.1
MHESHTQPETVSKLPLPSLYIPEPIVSQWQPVCAVVGCVGWLLCSTSPLQKYLGLSARTLPHHSPPAPKPQPDRRSGSRPLLRVIL